MNYISPEVIQKKGINEKADFWALGVLVFLMFFRKYPFFGSNRSETVFNISNRILDPCFNDGPKEIKEFILDLLNLDVKKRLGNCLEEFIMHPFFFDFDWNCVKDKKSCFFFFDEGFGTSYVKSGKSSFKDSVVEFDKESKARYFIDGFSFDNEDTSFFE